MPASHTTAPQVLNALNMSAVAPVAGYGGVAIQIQGTFTGTITFEASVQGSEFEPFRVTKSDNSTAVTTATTTGVYVGTVAGYSVIRARMSSYSNGGASVMIGAAPAAPGGAGGGGGSGTDVNLIEVGGAGISLGQAAMAASLPVVIASNQSAVHVIVDSGGGSNASVGATGAAAPASATYVGVSNASGDLAGLASVAVDLNSTTPPVVPVHGFYQALPGAGGPVVGGTATNPIITSVAAVVPGTGATNLGKAEDAAHTSGDVGVMALAVANTSQTDRAANNDYLPLASDLKGNLSVVGNLAPGATAAGAPVRVGAIAMSPNAVPASQDAGKVSELQTDLDQRLMVNPMSPATLRKHLDGSSAYTDESIAAAPGSGLRHVITFLSFSTGAATACNLFLEEGSTKIFGPIYLEAVAGRGYVSGPIWLPITANTAVTVTTSASIAQSIDVQYFTQAV